MTETIAAFERARGLGRPITTAVLPGTNHGLINPITGERPDFWPRIAAWLRDLRILVPRTFELSSVSKSAEGPFRFTSPSAHA